MDKATSEQTIIALCTPQGSGALALIRLSGAQAFYIADSLAHLSSKKPLSHVPTHTIHHGYLVDHEDNDRIVDEVLFLVMKAPRTFTGEDSIEITCHNNPFIIESIISLAVKKGARTARAGEFTQRAVLNGKLDLIQAEALHDVIQAPNEYALKLSLAQLKGSLSSYIAALENDLIELVASVEASFEFLDEEQRDFSFDELVRIQLKKIIKKIDEALAGFSIQQHIKDGVRIALIGSVNAGKSTLFNALLKKDRAIVSNIAGTTRDSIEASVKKGSAFWLLIDTAGLRKTADVIEQEGIERSLIEAGKADVVLLVIDSSQRLDSTLQELYKKLSQDFSAKCLVVVNKIDQEDPSAYSFYSCFDKYVKVAGKNKEGIQALEDAVLEKVELLFAQKRSPFLLNQRHYRVLKELSEKLSNLESFVASHIEYELLAYHLKDILTGFAELTGKSIDEKVMDSVFSTFCIGK